MIENDPLGVVGSDERFVPWEDEHHSYEENFINGLLLSMYRAAQLEREHGEHRFEHDEEIGKQKEQMFNNLDEKRVKYGRKN